MIQQFISQCPNTVAQDLVKTLKNIASNKAEIERALTDRIAAVEQTEYTWNNGGILFDPLYITETLERLYRLGGGRYEELHKLGVEINMPKYTHNDLISQNMLGSMAILDRNFYRKLLDCVTRTVEKVQFYDYISAEEEEVLNEVKEMLAGCDICVDVYNTEAMIRAVNLGMTVVQIELLQQIYIFHTIHERYENHNSLSSRDLEKVNGRNTYYYTLFRQVGDLLEKDEQPNRMVALKGNIKLAFVHERQKYTEQLITGAKDE